MSSADLARPLLLILSLSLATRTHTIKLVNLKGRLLFVDANASKLLGQHTAERVYDYGRRVGERGAVMEIILASD